MKIRAIAIITLFAIAGALTTFFRVERHAQAKSVNLSAIPSVIGEWQMVSQKEDLGAREEKFLDEMLIRTYERRDGKRIMLAIAYGADQRKKFSVHLPEVCYAASGCKVTSVGQTVMSSPNLSLKQMLAKTPEGAVEAVQYWIVLDGKVVTGDLQGKASQAYYGTFGADAGGALIRISSLATDGDHKKDFEIQKEFVSSINTTLGEEQRRLIFGVQPLSTGL